ncbi:hypothetical protein LZ30DRAFT_701916 [Colletotrichum cereale]|nr:hypothetical protein LZ30DRAFT_701916 [Colletotrichum cereale]
MRNILLGKKKKTCTRGCLLLITRNLSHSHFPGLLVVWGWAVIVQVVCWHGWHGHGQNPLRMTSAPTPHEQATQQEYQHKEKSQDAKCGSNKTGEVRAALGHVDVDGSLVGHSSTTSATCTTLGVGQSSILSGGKDCGGHCDSRWREGNGDRTCRALNGRWRWRWWRQRRRRRGRSWRSRRWRRRECTRREWRRRWRRTGGERRRRRRRTRGEQGRRRQRSRREWRRGWWCPR